MLTLLRLQCCLYITVVVVVVMHCVCFTVVYVVFLVIVVVVVVVVAFILCLKVKDYSPIERVNKVLCKLISHR